VDKKLNFNALRGARQARRLSLPEVSSYAKIAEKRLRAFEAGSASPSVNQITVLSELYNVPYYEFYGTDELDLADLVPDFRKSSPQEADLSPRGLSRMWQVERGVEFVGQLTAELGKAAPITSRFERLTNKSVVQPDVLRANFDNWLSERAAKLRLTGSREDIFSKHLRLYLEVHGCHTVVNTAPIEDYLGFYLNKSVNSNVIFVNRDVRNEKRRLFTLSHELAHFAYDQEGVSNPFIAKNEIERQCNAFAAEFLAPDDQVLRIVEGFTGPVNDSISRLVELVSSKTLLSRQASTLRLQALDVVSKKTASQFMSHLSKIRRLDEPKAEATEKPVMGRNAVIAMSLSKVGVYAAYTASVALKNKIVDRTDIVRGLGLSESIQSDVLKLATKRFEVGAV
jgi:Zn-dependent peptidase ImmA (M78 family)/transcriptional regulator with XRE-family HTH domain